MLKSNQSHHLYGFTDLKSLNERGPLVISYGKGIYVYDIHNKKYLDANSGLWNACAGFDHHGLVEVAKKSGCNKSELIDDEKKLPIRDILQCKNIGISSGASAPEFLVKNMIKQIEEKAIVKINVVETIKEKIYFKIPNNLN